MGVALRHNETVFEVVVLNSGEFMLILTNLIDALGNFFGPHDASHAPSLHVG